MREGVLRRSAGALRMIVAAVLLMAVAAGARAEDKTYGFIVPLGSNMRSENLVAMLNGVSKVFSKQIGLEFKVMTPQYVLGADVAKIVDQYFKEGKASFAYVHPRDLVTYLDAGGKNLVPIATIEMFGKPTSKMCLYTRKKDGFKSLADLKGKVWGSGCTLASTYQALSEKGIKEPPEKFFSKMIFIDDRNKADLIDVLMSNKADVVTTEEYTMVMPLMSHKQGKDVQALYCSDYYHNWIFAAKKDVPVELVDSIRKLFLRVHKDKAFQEFWWFLSAIKGKFVPVEQANLKRTRELIKIENKNGWYEKEKKFLGDNWKKVEAKSKK